MRTANLAGRRHFITQAGVLLPLALSFSCSQCKGPMCPQATEHVAVLEVSALKLPVHVLVNIMPLLMPRHDRCVKEQ